MGGVIRVGVARNRFLQAEATVVIPCKGCGWGFSNFEIRHKKKILLVHMR